MQNKHVNTVPEQNTLLLRNSSSNENFCIEYESLFSFRNSIYNLILVYFCKHNSFYTKKCIYSYRKLIGILTNDPRVGCH